MERFRRPLSLGKGLENVTEEFCLEISDKFLDFCSNKPGTVKGALELVTFLRAQGCHLHICSNGFHEIQYKKLRAVRMQVQTSLRRNSLTMPLRRVGQRLRPRS